MFSIPDAARVLGVKAENPSAPALIEGASIDTRTLQPGNLFVAIRGQKDDGHRFLETAFARGASGALVERDYYEKNKAALSAFKNLLPVADTGAALVDLARAYRSLFDLNAVGITGSVGKTSTKEFLAYLFSKKYKVLATAGNFNNHIGLPLTLFRLREGDQVCVAELGASAAGEIRFLSTILKPQAAIITKIAPSHLQGFGSIEKIYEAKSELLEALPPGSFAVLPDDDPLLVHKAEQLKLKPVLVGDSWRAHYKVTDERAEDGKVRFTLVFKKMKKEFSFPGLASFLARNAAMAIALADVLGLPLSEIPSDWDDLKLPSGRFEERMLGPVRFIYDGYNASPASFDAALQAFSGMKVTGNKYLAFSDMLELGPQEEEYHRELGRKIAEAGIPYFCYGPLAAKAAEAARKSNAGLEGAHFSSFSELASHLNAKIRGGDAVLLKASRGMKIEEVFNWIQARQEAPATR